MRKALLFTPLMAIIATGAAYGQDSTEAVFAGRVTSQDNSPLQGVRIQIESPSLLMPRQAVTDASGSFRVRLLPGGEYTITYSLSGYVTRRMTTRMIAGTTSSGSTKLQSIAVQEAVVEISASTSNIIQVDKTETIVQTAFSSERLEEIGGRDFKFLVGLTAGADFAGGTEARLNIRGGLDRSTKTLMNGQNITDMFRGSYELALLPLEDQIESIAIIQSPLNSRYGNTDGGLVSIVTKRGTNSFSGSMRFGNGNSAPRQFWRAYNLPYTDRRGAPLGTAPGTPNDSLGKYWEFSLNGPIVPNYLTFSYGGKISPITYSSGYVRDSATSPFVASTWRTVEPDRRKLGTFYMDNDPTSANYGTVIRRSELDELGAYDAMYYNETWSAENSFTLFGQIAQNHQVTYNFRQNETRYEANAGYGMGDTSKDYRNSNLMRAWSLGYKGIMGSSGVLDIHFGRSTVYTEQPAGGRDTITVRTYASVNPMDASGDIDSFANYHHNGALDAAIYQSWGNLGAGSSLHYHTLGWPRGGSTGSGVNSSSVNYQHMLEYKGSHIIDVGFNREDADAELAPPAPHRQFNVPGRIATDLTAADIRNIYGGSTGPVGNYAGKYIVFNVGTAWVHDVDPYMLTRAYGANNRYVTDGPLIRSDGTIHPDFNFGNNFVFTAANGYATINAGTSNWPYMVERWGLDSGSIKTDMQSFYLNDMWTIDDHHSVMLGLRMDKYKLADEGRSNILSYTKPTLRLEYKFDIHGDQSRLAAVSFGQFHQMAQLGLYSLFVDQQWGNETVYLWNTGPSHYHLVDQADILNPNNYRLEYVTNLGGSLTSEIEKKFRPPTSTEISVWFRRRYDGGGYWKASFVTRSWADLYDFFTGDVFDFANPNTGATTKRLKTVLRNSDDFKRSYAGAELQWDFPFSKRFGFGGNFSYSRLMSNQTDIGASATTGQTTINSIPWQTTWHWDEMVGRLFDVDAGAARSIWAPKLRRNNELSARYYLTVNLTDGKVRSNFSLNGSYTGSSNVYDFITYRVGYPVIEGVNPNATTNSTGGSSLRDIVNIVENVGTGVDSHAHHLRYNLTLPMAKKLSWYIAIDINNVFNHRPKNWVAPASAQYLSHSATQTTYGTAVVPWVINGPTPIQPNNQFPNGWYWNTNVSTYYSTRAENYRSFVMSTALRF